VDGIRRSDIDNARGQTFLGVAGRGNKPSRNVVVKVAALPVIGKNQKPITEAEPKAERPTNNQ
jgi:hypothetical protein